MHVHFLGMVGTWTSMKNGRVILFFLSQTSPHYDSDSRIILPRWTPLKKNGAIKLDVAFHVQVQCIYVIVLLLNYKWWSYGSYMYNYLCNQCLSPLKLFESRSWRGVLDATLCDKVCQFFVTGPWFSPDTPVFSTNKTYRHDKTEIWLKVVLNTLKYRSSLSSGIVVFNLHEIRDQIGSKLHRSMFLAISFL